MCMHILIPGSELFLFLFLPLSSRHRHITRRWGFTYWPNHSGGPGAVHMWGHQWQRICGELCPYMGQQWVSDHLWLTLMILNYYEDVFQASHHGEFVFVLILVRVGVRRLGWNLVALSDAVYLWRLKTFDRSWGVLATTWRQTCSVLLLCSWSVRKDVVSQFYFLWKGLARMSGKLRVGRTSMGISTCFP